MLLNEHQSKTLFAEAGVPVPPGALVRPETAASFQPDGEGPWFCKAQVLAGGRGKAGGILRVDDPADFPATFDRLFKLKIKGHAVPLVRVEPGTAIRHEFYLSFAVARSRRSLVLTVSPAGGMDVEAQDAGARLIQNISATAGPAAHQLRAAFFKLGLGKAEWPGFQDLVTRLYGAVKDYGLLLAEINPLVLTNDGQWIALDGKAEIDDNQRDLVPELDRFHEPLHATPQENEARLAGLSYVSMDGFVGLVANGAGLAMATMDLLNFHGLPVANFMDFGGAADKERMTTALRLLFDNPATRVIFINLFGGILSCEAVAQAMVAALGGKPPRKPLVARLDGFGAEEGRAILRALDTPGLHVVDTAAEALERLAELKPEGLAPREYKRFESAPIERPTLAVSEVQSEPFPLNKDSRVLIQGVTGRQAQRHVQLMLDYGANIVAGVTPFKGGGEVLGVPVYDSLRQALERHEIDASLIFVPAFAAADAILEAAAAELPFVICITEGVPQQQMLAVLNQMRCSRTRLIGPNTPGVIVPGQTKLGIMPSQVYTPGELAIFSRSGTLTYEAAARLSAVGVGQSVVAGIGGDPFIGLGFKEMLDLTREDPATKAVLMLGEIGGNAEEELALYARRTNYPKPILAFIAGQTAPPGKRLGHAGAILDEGGGGIGDKLAALHEAGILLSPDLQSLPDLARKALKLA